MTLRVAVVGVGRFGKEHARVYSKLPGVRLIGVVDASLERAKEVADRCNTKASTDFRELFGQVDAVSIAAPTQHHFQIAKAFLEQNVHALIEKPIARSVAETEELVRLAQGKVLQVGHIERFNPAFQAALPHVSGVRMIEAHRCAPFRFRSADIDVVLDVMIHDLDLLLALEPSEVTRVEATGRPVMFSNTDMALVRIEFESGATAHVTANRAAAVQERTFVIHSDRGTASIDFGAKACHVATFNEEMLRAQRSAPKTDSPSEDDLKKFPQEFYRFESIAPTAARESLEVELESFVKAVKGEAPTVVTGEHALRVMRLAERIQREIREHRWKPASAPSDRGASEGPP